MLLTLVFGTLLCGAFASILPSTRIVGGQEAKRGEFPYIVSIQQYNQHFCGGSILNADTILTAAHCVPDIAEENLWQYGIQYGILNWKEEFNNRIPFSEVIVHPQYDSQRKINDIALIRLAGRIPLDANVKAITLPNRSLNTNENIILAGWGRQSATGPKIEKLQRTDLNVYADSTCKRYYPGYVAGDMNCAAGAPVRLNSAQCRGDSGGPLAKPEGGMYVQYGVVSYSMKVCGSAPGVFTNVFKYNDWIWQNA